MTRGEKLAALSATMPPINCGGCTSCCRNDVVRLDPVDDPFAYRWHLEGGRPVLDRTPDGSCVYRTASGCGIHGHAPRVCRRFDCRALFLDTPLKQRSVLVRKNPQMIHIYAAGHKRLQALEA